MKGGALPYLGITVVGCRQNKGILDFLQGHLLVVTTTGIVRGVVV